MVDFIWHIYLNLIGSYGPCYDPTIYDFPINDLRSKETYLGDCDWNIIFPSSGLVFNGAGPLIRIGSWHMANWNIVHI